MTLIPLISAIVTTPEAATAPMGGDTTRRGGYDPGAGHRPLAALFAVGLPAALVVAVALSPMIVTPPPRSAPQDWKNVILEKPKPPKPEPDAKPESKPRESHVTTTPTPLPPTAQNPPETTPALPQNPPMGNGSGTTLAADPPLPPARPPLILADLDPRFAGMFQPDYPAREQRNGTEGSARVRVLIGTDGRVKAVELISTDSPGFFEETRRRALAKWRFKPATRGGLAEESWKVMTVRFQIRDG